MAWTTRAGHSAAVLVKDGGSSVNSFPFGIMKTDGSLRVYYNQDVFNIGWKDSADLGLTWTGPSTTYKFWGDLPSGNGGGFTTIRRGRSGRFHAAISRFTFGGTWTTTYPNGTGWTIHYDAYYSYSDDGSTWSSPVEIFYESGPHLETGSFTPMEVVELSNGDIIFTGDYYEHVNYMTSAGDLLATRLYRSTDGGASFTYENDIITPATWGALTSEFQCDVIHDGSATGLLVATVADYSVGDPPRRRVLRSLDGGATWNYNLAHLGTTVNRGGILAHPDGDVIITACGSHAGNDPKWWVSRDQGVTYTAMGSLIAGTSQPAASGTGGAIGNKWITPFVIDDQGSTPNLGVCWGSGYDDAHGSTFFRSFTRGADVPPGVEGFGNTVSSGYGDAETYTPPPASITVDPASTVWQQSGTSIIARVNPDGPAAVSAVVEHTDGGLVRFRGANASRFEISLDGATWASTATVAAGATDVFLRVTPEPEDSGATLVAEIGVPV